MQIRRAILLFAIVSAVQMLTACSDQNPNAANTVSQNGSDIQTADADRAEGNFNTVRDNPSDLALIVKLPFEPQEVVWREDKLNNQTGDSPQPSAQNERRLTAVLSFSAENAERIVAQAAAHGQSADGSNSVESWFPAELIARSELSGDDTLKGTAHAANDFFQPPYSEGRIFRVQNSNYFVLELLSK